MPSHDVARVPHQSIYVLNAYHVARGAAGAVGKERYEFAAFIDATGLQAIEAVIVPTLETGTGRTHLSVITRVDGLPQ